MSGEQVLQVLIGDLPVGRLSIDPQERCEFRLLESYKQAWPRPILGQSFLDAPNKVHSTRARVPPWFSNLLPEGPLRELIARRAGVSENREFYLLHHLGDDLPGDVRLVAEEAIPPPEGRLSEEQPIHPQPWRFSLAGVQLKFSANKRARGLTIPISGQGGDWIVKLPDTRYPHVPRNEWATMRWARASGIEIPEIELIELRNIDGLPESLHAHDEQYAFAIRRFDRPRPGRRIHMEDFAQILGLFPQQKYERYNYETLAALIRGITDEEGLDKFLHRLLFVIASGNGDAHHKNWTLIYPDGVNAKLSPAYDLVSTLLYLPEDKLALNFAKSKRFSDVGMDSFLRLARKIDVDEAWMRRQIEQYRRRILDGWSEIRDEFDFVEDGQKKLDAHLARIPVFRGRGGPPGQAGIWRGVN